ncbi:hypothetical protein pb186bvf_007845 [Paramecium bursaria]
MLIRLDCIEKVIIFYNVYKLLITKQQILLQKQHLLQFDMIQLPLVALDPKIDIYIRRNE